MAVIDQQTLVLLLVAVLASYNRALHIVTGVDTTGAEMVEAGGEDEREVIGKSKAVETLWTLGRHHLVLGYLDNAEMVSETGQFNYKNTKKSNRQAGLTFWPSSPSSLSASTFNP